jgi:hypothetical protein
LSDVNVAVFIEGDVRQVHLLGHVVA